MDASESWIMHINNNMKIGALGILLRKPRHVSPNYNPSTASSIVLGEL